MGKVAFMHVPKAGGVSVLNTCRKFNIDIIDHDIRRDHYYSIVEYKRDNPDSFIFSFVRNPWDRAVSAFFFLQQGGINGADKVDAKKFLAPYKEDFNRFVIEQFVNPEYIFQQLHFRPEYLWLTNKEGRLLTDYIGKLENLKPHSQAIIKKIGINEKIELPHLNKSERAKYTNYYDEETIQLIGNAYAEDIEFFGYSFK